MGKMDWSDGGRVTPYRLDRSNEALEHERKIEQLTLKKYRQICEMFPDNSFCKSGLRQSKHQGWISKKQAQVLRRMEANDNV